MKVFLTIVFYIVVFIIALKLWRVLGCMLHRLRFVAKLKRTVEKKCGSVKILHSPLRSFFSVYDGEDISIRLDGKMIALKFFPFFLKGKNIILNDQKQMTTQKNFILFGGGKGGTARPKINDASAIYSAKSKNYSSVFSPSAGKKIMLFSPAPISMKAIQNGSATILDNSVEIYHFSVYTAKGFLQNLDR